MEELREEVEVRNKRSLQNNWHVGRVEKLDWVASKLTAVTLIFDLKIHTPSLEINDDNKHEHCSEQVGNVGQVLAVKGLFESSDLIRSRDD